MNEDNTQGGAEPSPASAGSHGEPVAWAVRYGLDPDPEVYWHYPRHAAESGRIIVALYRSPTLTDEEREAVEQAVGFCECTTSPLPTSRQIATIRGLLERVK